MSDPRLRKLAELLVRYSVGVQKDQVARIAGPSVAEPLIVELTRAVIAAGGHPLVRMMPDEVQEIMVKQGSDQQLRYCSPIAVQEYQTVACSFTVWGESNTKSMTNCDPARLALARQARKPLMELFMQRAAAGELKWTGTQFPCQASAQDAEMSLSEYEDFVFTAGKLDHPDPVAVWNAISIKQQRLVDWLNGKTDYRVVAANGTDVRMSLAGRTWINCDGHENFPDGEVFTGPVVESVDGTIVFSFPAVHAGRECDGVRLVFRHGKVVDASATKGEAFLISMLDMDSGSRFVGECAIGTNYDIRRYTRNTLFDEKIGGTVHFALGAGYPETGNQNRSGLHWDMVVDLRQGGHVEVDGTKINIDGQFTAAGMPGRD